MGESSIFQGTLQQDQVTVNGYQFKLNNAAQFGLTDGACLVGIRPEAISFKETGEAAQRCSIKSAVYMGNHWEIVANWGGQDLLVNTNPEQFNPELKEAYVHLAEHGVFLLKPE